LWLHFSHGADINLIKLEQNHRSTAA